MRASIFLVAFLQICLISNAFGIPSPIVNPVSKWRFQTGGPIRGGVLADPDKIYFGSSDGYVYALRKTDGELAWKFQTQGAVNATPALADNKLIVTGRDNYVYCLNPKTGQLIWKFQMLPNVKFEMEWDYSAAAPVISGNKVLVGSGDSHLYALTLDQGKLLWKFKTDGRVRATPLVTSDKIYLASMDGFVYVLNLKDGVQSWKYKTYGTTLDSKKSRYDRTSIFSSPRLADSLLVFGSRDGATYCVNVNTQKRKWVFFYDGTWAMSAPIIENGVVYMGWSTNFHFNAIDLLTGKEKWKFVAKGVLYANPIVVGEEIITASADHKIYSLNKSTGKVNWEYKTGAGVFCSPLMDNQVLYVGSDDGIMYAIQDGQRALKAVYDPIPRNAMFEFCAVESKIAPYLKERGFERLDSAKLYHFLQNRIQDKTPSVIAFTYQDIPDNIMGENAGESLLRKYLEAGGKILWFGDIPKRFLVNEKGQIKAVDDVAGTKLLDVKIVDLFESGNYFSKSTQAGLNWGLSPTLMSTYSTVSPEGIVPLAFDEYNRPTMWVKKFTERAGSGFVSFRSWPWHAPFPEDNLPLIYRVATYGLE